MLSTFPTADTPLRPLGKAGEPDTTAGLSTSKERKTSTHQHSYVKQHHQNKKEKDFLAGLA